MNASRFYFLLLILFLSCKTYQPKQVINNSENELLLNEDDKVLISSDESDYEIIIFEPGFNAWLDGTARPRGFYSQKWLENRNRILIQEWNLRHSQPARFNQNLYQLRIDYDIYTDYGYEVNYKLYNYLVYFQLKYNQKLSSFNPRI